MAKSIINGLKQRLVQRLFEEYGVRSDIIIEVRDRVDTYSEIRFSICLLCTNKPIYNYSTQINHELLKCYSDTGMEPILDHLIDSIVYGFTPLVKIKKIGNSKQQAILFIRDSDKLVRKHCSNVLYNKENESYEIS